MDGSHLRAILALDPPRQMSMFDNRCEPALGEKHAPVVGLCEVSITIKTVASWDLVYLSFRTGTVRQTACAAQQLAG